VGIAEWLEQHETAWPADDMPFLMAYDQSMNESTVGAEALLSCQPLLGRRRSSLASSLLASPSLQPRLRGSAISCEPSPLAGANRGLHIAA
jgi:hypothetical protein